MVIRDARSHVADAPRLVVCTPRRFQLHIQYSLVLRGVSNFITITSLVLLFQSSEISVTAKAAWSALLGSDTLLNLTHPSLHSTSCQTLLVAPSNSNTFCWCVAACCWWASTHLALSFHYKCSLNADSSWTSWVWKCGKDHHKLVQINMERWN